MSYDETQKQDQADADEEAEERKVRFQFLTGRAINYFFVKIGYCRFLQGTASNLSRILNVKTLCFYFLDIITLGPILNHTLVRMFTHTHFTYVKETF